MSKHYRKRIDLNMDQAHKARSKLEALREMAADLLRGAGVEKTINDKAVSELTVEMKVSFETAMNNDLDTPSAVNGVFGAVQRLHSLQKTGRIGREQTLAIGNQLLRTDSVLQVLF